MEKETFKYNELALLIQEPSEPDRYLSAPASNWTVQFVTMEDRKPRNISDGYEYSHELRGYEDLQIITYLWADRTRSTGSWSLAYKEIYRAELRDLQRRVKTLESLERKLEKQSKLYGYPQSFGEFIAQLMVAAGIKRALYMRKSNGSSTYDDQEFSYMDSKDARYRIERMAWEWHEKNDTKKESDAA